MEDKKLLKCLFLSIFVVSLIGAVVCFPLKMRTGDTCLLHHYLEKPNQGNGANYLNKDLLIKQYLKPFAFIWWLSLIGIIFSIHQLKKLY